MGIRRERRDVPQEVTVTECDGPGCTVNRVNIDRYAQDGLPATWFSIKQALAESRFGSDRDPKALEEPVIFHTWRCLVAWMDHHRLGPVQTNLPLAVPRDADDADGLGGTEPDES